MTLFCYLNGTLGAPKLLEEHTASVQKLLSGDYCKTDLEMLRGYHGVYSFRLSNKARLIFTTITVDGAQYLLLLDYLPTHDYHKCKYLNPQILKKYIQQQQASMEAAASTDNEPLQFAPVTSDKFSELKDYLKMQANSTEALTAKPAYFYKENMVVLNPLQEETLQLQLPAIVTGVAGSGKSCVALAALAKAANAQVDERPIWYITQSRLLVEEMRSQWAMQAHEDTTQTDEHTTQVEFLTYEDFLQRVTGVLPGSLVDEAHFSEWYKKHVNVEKKKPAQSYAQQLTYPDAKRAYQEFRLCSGYGQEAYISLGKRQSRLEHHQRAWLYATYEAYQAHLASEHRMNSAFYPIQTEGDSPCAMIVVDESQDFSTLALRTLHQISNNKILYCLDSHQRIEDDLSVMPFLKTHLEIPNTNCVALSATYRCPLKIELLHNPTI